MRIDTISIFPEFFNVLDLSLIGKAKENHYLIFIHIIYSNWADDKHLSVG